MQENKLNLHIYGIHFLNPYKTVVSHLKIYDAAVAKTSLKIPNLRLTIFFVIISVCITFKSWQDFSETEFRVSVSRLGKKIQIRACVFTFSL